MSQRASMMAHLEALTLKHDDLERNIQELYRRFVPDAMIQPLKKQKLRIKEEMVALRHKLDQLTDNRKAA